jgi:hypothetical protein
LRLVGRTVGLGIRRTAGFGDKEVEVEAPALPALPASPASPALQMRPKRARKVPARYQG